MLTINIPLLTPFCFDLFIQNCEFLKHQKSVKNPRSKRSSSTTLTADLIALQNFDENLTSHDYQQLDHVVVDFWTNWKLALRSNSFSPPILFFLSEMGRDSFCTNHEELFEIFPKEMKISIFEKSEQIPIWHFFVKHSVFFRLGTGLSDTNNIEKRVDMPILWYILVF